MNLVLGTVELIRAAKLVGGGRSGRSRLEKGEQGSGNRWLAWWAQCTSLHLHVGGFTISLAALKHKTFCTGPGNLQHQQKDQI